MDYNKTPALLLCVPSMIINIIFNINLTQWVEGKHFVDTIALLISPFDSRNNLYTWWAVHLT